jgi:6-phosphogluconate dehydrogenase
MNRNGDGYKVAVSNRTVSEVAELLAGQARGAQVVGADSVEEVCSLLKSARRVMILVKACEVVEQTIAQMAPSSKIPTSFKTNTGANV